MISVVMGVHRVDEHLLESINSILIQTHREFEFLIVINGVSREEVAKYISDNVRDERVVVLKSRIPQLSHALNVGIDNSSFEYIARMDSDDIADPERLEKQLRFMIDNDLDLVGSGAILIDKDGEVIGERASISSKEIDRKMVYKNCFIHPTVMYKKESVIKARGYNAGFNSEDYDLWLRMKRMGVRWANMPDSLLQYRMHDQATQGQPLGYAECAGYSLREFIIRKSWHGLFSILYNITKSVIKGGRRN